MEGLPHLGVARGFIDFSPEDCFLLWIKEGKSPQEILYFLCPFKISYWENWHFWVVLISSLNVLIIQHIAVQTSCFYHSILAEGVSVKQCHDGMFMPMCHCILCLFMSIPQCPVHQHSTHFCFLATRMPVPTVLSEDLFPAPQCRPSSSPSSPYPVSTDFLPTSGWGGALKT